MSTEDGAGRIADFERSMGRGRPLLVRTAMFVLLWLVLTDGSLKMFWLGILVAALAASVSLRLLPAGRVRIRWLGAARFLPHFLGLSISAALDVATRAFTSPPRVKPGIVSYEMTLPEGPARTFYAALLGLIPGTMTTRLVGDRLDVHLLDQTVDVKPQLATLEAKVADLFGLEGVTRRE